MKKLLVITSLVCFMAVSAVAVVSAQDAEQTKTEAVDEKKSEDKKKCSKECKKSCCTKKSSCSGH